MKSKAPSRVTLTAEEMLPWAVTMMTGRSGSNNRRRFSTVAAEVGHAHVQQDRVRSAAGRHFETDPSRFGFGDFKPGVRQDVAHDPSHVPIVVDNEDNGLLGHQDGLRTGPKRSGGRSAGSSR